MKIYKFDLQSCRLRSSFDHCIYANTKGNVTGGKEREKIRIGNEVANERRKLTGIERRVVINPLLAQGEKANFDYRRVQAWLVKHSRFVYYLFYWPEFSEMICVKESDY